MRSTNQADRSRGKVVRVGVVGLGYWGPNLARNIAELRGAELTWLCDRRPEVVEAVGLRYPGARTATEFAQVLADPTLDAVLIATSVASHYELAAEALRAGKHVFVEKPLAASSEQARELIALAERQRLVLMPGHTFLYSPPVAKIKELIDAGALGEIFFISTSRVNLGLHQPDVSVIWDLGPHDFSILEYWLGELPERISALSRDCIVPGLPDVAFVDLVFPAKTVAHVELSWLSPSKLRRTAIVGSHKMVVYDDTSTESVRIFDSGAVLPDPTTYGEYRLSYRTGDIISPRIDATEPLALELADFCHAIVSGEPPLSTAQIGLDVVRTIEAVERSLLAGGAPVPLDDLQKDVAPAGLDATAANGRTAAKVELRGPATGMVSAPRPGGGVGTAILGAGPAGLTGAHVLGRRGGAGAVFEADGLVGGISKTVEYDGFRFDLGGHRFFTKLAPIEQLWRETLGSDFVRRPRLSRIYYNGKYFAYPIAARDVVKRLGLLESTRCALSYIWASRRRSRDADTFEEWVTSRFGRRLYDAFFRSYTEKLWGIPGSEIKSLWAAQRIKNFSLGRAMLGILGIKQSNVTTLIEEFDYPRLGPGQMWEAFAANVQQAGIPIHLHQRCVSVKHAEGKVRSIVVSNDGDMTEHPVDHVLSSIALSDLVYALDPPPPPGVLAAAGRLRYRDLVLVALMTTEEEPFPDNWIYLHDPGTRAGRVQNYGAWSSDMVKPGTTCLGVEYFCFRGDEIWEMPAAEAVALATSELARIGLIDPTKVIDGVKVLTPKAYPMYDSNYEAAVETIRTYLGQLTNLETCGRNGLHRYNNQDHSMWTAILGMLNLLDGAQHDLWSVNVEAEYLEEGRLVAGGLELELLAPVL